MSRVVLPVLAGLVDVELGGPGGKGTLVAAGGLVGAGVGAGDASGVEVAAHAGVEVAVHADVEVAVHADVEAANKSDIFLIITIACLE